VYVTLDGERALGSKGREWDGVGSFSTFCDAVMMCGV
jgi:hypothetical protein